VNPKLLALPLAAAMVLAPSAAQALAAPSLPATDTLYTIECDSGPGSTIPPLQLFSVDAATGLLTAVGSGDAGTPDGDRCGAVPHRIRRRAACTSSTTPTTPTRSR